MNFAPFSSHRDTLFIRRSFRLPRRETAFLRFLVEAYDGLVFMRTLDGAEALVEISYAPSCQGEAEAFLRAVAPETGLVEVPSVTAAPI